MAASSPRGGAAPDAAPPQASAPPRASAPPQASARETALRVFRTYLLPRWPELLGALACAVAAGLVTGALMYLLNPVVKGIFEQKRFESLLMLPAAICLLGLFRAGAQIGQATLVNRLGHTMVGDMQVRTFGRLLRADLAQLRERHSGAYVSSVLYDAGLIREAATNGLVNYIRAGVQVAALLGVMFYQDWLLALIVLAAGPLVSGGVRRFGKRSRKAAHGAMSETAALSTAVMESLDGVKLVKIDTREAVEEARVAAVVARRQRHIIKGANARAAAAPATEAASTLVTAAVIAYAGVRAQRGELTLGELISFLGSLMAAAQSLRELANLQTVFSEGLAAAGRLFAALDVEPQIRDAPTARVLPKGEARIRFEGVGFAYGADAPALEGVTLEAGRGRAVALVGPSGGGKSTILNLIPRLYDVSAGRVTIDGADVREVTLASLRSQIALVTQEPILFDETVRANIAWARPQASQAEIEAAAEAAAAADFIAGLPRGYDTVVGEAGARLSGGQRQRIAIARAFLKDAPILLLDEATSALDTESERKVQAALDRLMAGRTTLMIAHRLSTVRNADRIYVIDRGRVAESGTHGELVARGGLYSRLARAQNLDVLGVAAEPAPAPAA